MAQGKHGRKGHTNNYLYRYGPVRSMLIRFERAAKRLEVHAARLRAYGLPDPTVADVAQQAVEKARLTAELLAKVPKNWRPARGTIGGALIEKGDDVQLRASAASKYEGIFSDGQVLHVEHIIGSRVVCSTLVDGKPMLVPLLKSHVTRVPE